MTGTNVGSVFFDIGANDKGFKNSVKSNAAFAEKGFGKAFAKLGKLAIAAFSIKAITDFAKSSIDLASDLAEVQNVIDVTFGAGNKKIEDFAKSSMTSFGLSELSAKQYMGTMGAMLKSMGLSSQAVEDMSINIAGLAGDMASFYNLDTDEAFSKIRSGISGETEPLKQLGINMSVANMEAFALSKGIKKSYNSMTQAEQALLRYNYLMSVTSDAQGDFARTSDGWANQVRVLQLQWDSFKASLGSAFIVVLTPVLKGLNWLVSKLIVAADAFKNFINLISGGKVDAEASSGGVAAVGAAAEEAGEQAAKGAKKAKGALASFDELNNLSSSSDSGGGGDAGGDAGMGGFDLGSVDTSATTNPALESTASLLDIITSKVKNFLQAWGLLEPFNSFVNTCKLEFGLIGEKAVESWGKISSAATTAFPKIVGSIKPLLAPLANLGLQYGELFVTFYSAGLRASMGIISTAAAEIMNVLSAAMQLGNAILQPVIASLTEFFSANLETMKLRATEVWATIETSVCEYLTAISTLYQTIFGGLTEWFTENSASVQELLTTTWETLWVVLDTVWTAIQTVFTAVFGGIADFINSHATEIKDTLINTWDIIWQVLQPIWNTICDVFKTVFGGIKDFLVENTATIREVISLALEFIWEIIKVVLDKIKAFWDQWGGVIMAAIDGVLQHIKNIFETVWNLIRNSLEGVLNVIKNILKAALAVLKGDWEGAWNSIKAAFDAWWQGIKNVFNIIADFFKKTFTNVKNTLKNVWDQILVVFKAPINTIIGWINALIKAWNSLSFKVPEMDLGPLGSFGGFTIGLPKIKEIPQLAKGGVVDQPTLSVIGEAGKEAVVPLENNTGWMVSLANILADAIVAKLAMAQGDNSNQSTTLKLVLDGREMGEVLLDYLISAADRRGLKLALGR